MLRVTTANVNGLRAAARKGFLAWLEATTADVVCLQEVRAEPGQLPAELRDPGGWHAYHAPAAAKGRAGVSVLSRRAPAAVRVGFGAAEFDASGRYLEIDLPHAGTTVTIGSLYLPSGEVGTARQDEKYRFMDAFAGHLAALRARAGDSGSHAVVCGDWNIAHEQADLKNWRANQKAAGFLPEERAWLSRVLAPDAWVDVVRDRHPGVAGPYSWWSYRGRAFDNDSGWRIDLQVATPGLAKTALDAVVERAARHELRWSDHAPVSVSYGI
jgi:exodeoxyribonuclease III